jgi:precorrin-4 methylase
MSERETKEIKTPQNHTATVKTYLTGREVDAVLAELFKDQDVTENPKIKMTTAITRNNKLIEGAVVSLDGSTENIFERLQDLPASEKAFILKEVQELAGGNF